MKERIVIKRYGYDDDTEDLVSHNEFASREELKKTIAKAICRCDNRLISCRHCLTYFYQGKQDIECERILSEENDLDASYMDRAEAVLNDLLERDKP